MTPDFITTSDPLIADNFTFLSLLNANANGETNLQGSDPVKISTTFSTTTEPNFSTGFHPKSAPRFKLKPFQ
jgi:hypothetical protein